MNDLSLEFKSNLQKLFIEKKFSELEIEIESLGDHSKAKYVYDLN